MNTPGRSEYSTLAQQDVRVPSPPSPSLYDSSAQLTSNLRSSNQRLEAVLARLRGNHPSEVGPQSKAGSEPSLMEMRQLAHEEASHIESNIDELFKLIG